MSYVLEAIKAVKNALKEPFEYQTINYGGQALYIEGFKRAAVIESEKMQFVLKKKLLTVTGAQLSLVRLTEGTCLIEGMIEGVYES